MRQAVMPLTSLAIVERVCVCMCVCVCVCVGVIRLAGMEPEVFMIGYYKSAELAVSLTVANLIHVEANR